MLIQKIKDGQAPHCRPELKDVDSDMHPGVSMLMKQCWAEELSQRLSFDEIAKALRTINKGKSVYRCLLLTKLMPCASWVLLIRIDHTNNLSYDKHVIIRFIVYDTKCYFNVR